MIKKSVGLKSSSNSLTGELEIYSSYSPLNGPLLKITLPTENFVEVSNAIEKAVRMAEDLAVNNAVSVCKHALNLVRVESV